MTEEERLKLWAGYAEISRKWVSVMDTKAGFIAALNLGLLALLWSGAKVQDGGLATKVFGALATLCIGASILCAIWVALPRESLAKIFGKGVRWSSDYRPISYYGYIAQTYRSKDFEALRDYAENMSVAQLATEALEQHLVISHSAQKKSGYVKLAGFALLAAVGFAVAAVLTRLCV